MAKIVLDNGQEIELSKETAENIIRAQKSQKKIWVAIGLCDGHANRIMVRLPRSVIQYLRTLSDDHYEYQNDELVVTFNPDNGMFGTTLCPRGMLKLYSDSKSILEM